MIKNYILQDRMNRTQIIELIGKDEDYVDFLGQHLFNRVREGKEKSVSRIMYRFHGATIFFDSTIGEADEEGYGHSVVVSASSASLNSILNRLTTSLNIKRDSLVEDETEVKILPYNIRRLMS